MFNESTSEAEQAIARYIEKAIKAGSGVAHMLGHLQHLHDREKLISSSSLQKSKQLALREDPQVSMKVSSPPCTSVRGKAPEIALSDLHNASVCCLAFLKSQDSRGLHHFNNVSLSLSHSGKYLIAVGDETTYIAFQSEPVLTVWPEKYKSFDDGMCSVKIKLLSS